MEPRPKYPGFWHAVLLCTCFLALQVGLGIGLAILDMVLHVESVHQPLVIGFVNTASCAGTMALAWWIGRRSWSDVCPLKRISNGVVAAVILSCTGAMIVLSEVDNLFRTILPVPQVLADIFNSMRGGEEHVLAGGFLMVIVAPFTEELIFRGVILKGFLQRFSLVKAAILSSILFGLVHLNPWQFVSGSLLGLLFAWWYARTGSLWPSLLGHAFVNGSFWLFALLPFEIQGFNSSEYTDAPQFQPLWFDVLGVSLLSLGGWLFHRHVPPGAPHLSSAQSPPALPPLLEPAPPTQPGEGN